MDMLFSATLGSPISAIVGSLMWMANQTRPRVGNAVPAITRFSHDPIPIHYKATQKILECLTAKSDSALPLKRGGGSGSIQGGFGLGAYIDADYAHRPEDRLSVCGVVICRGSTLVPWFSRTQRCVTLLTTCLLYTSPSPRDRG